MRWPAILGGACSLGAAAFLAGCKPPAFATSETAALSGPPPVLQAGQRAFWNDVGAQSYGVIELGAGVYRYGAAVCKVARSTVIGPQAPQGSNIHFLYCRGVDGAWRIAPAVVCRPVQDQAAATCRTGEGSYVRLPPA